MVSGSFWSTSFIEIEFSIELIEMGPGRGLVGVSAMQLFGGFYSGSGQRATRIPLKLKKMIENLPYIHFDSFPENA